MGPHSRNLHKKGKIVAKAKGEKAAFQDFDTPLPKGLRRKNPTISPPHTPHPEDDDDEAESCLDEEILDEGRGLKIEATSIDKYEPPLSLAPLRCLL